MSPLLQEQIRAFRLHMEGSYRALNAILTEIERCADTPAASDSRLAVILSVITERYGFTTAQLYSKARPASLTEPRHVYCALARKHTGIAEEAIGRSIGRNRHSVINSMKAVDALYSTNPAFKSLFDQLDACVASKFKALQLDKSAAGWASAARAVA